MPERTRSQTNLNYLQGMQKKPIVLILVIARFVQTLAAASLEQFLAALTMT